MLFSFFHSVPEFSLEKKSILVSSASHLKNVSKKYLNHIKKNEVEFSVHLLPLVRYSYLFTKFSAKFAISLLNNKSLSRLEFLFYFQFSIHNSHHQHSSFISLSIQHQLLTFNFQNKYLFSVSDEREKLKWKKSFVHFFVSVMITVHVVQSSRVGWNWMWKSWEKRDENKNSSHSLVVVNFMSN